jgi:SNF2 family DNA or RNA helicase
MTVLLERATAPLPLREIGLSEVNQVGIAPDAVGTTMICFAGNHKSLTLLSGVPGARRWSEWGCLAMPANRQNCLLIETVARVEDATDEYIQLRNELLAAPKQYAHLYPTTPEGEPDPLPHQVDAFCFALQAFERGFNGFGQYSEQGLGKSRWACDLIRHTVTRVAVVIAQNSTLLQWQDWLNRICGGFGVCLLSGCSIKQRAALIDDVAQNNQVLSAPIIFLVNWEVISRLESSLVRLRPDMVIADECTRAKERTAQMSKALHRIGAVTQFRIGMSGTPIGNDPGDLWSIYKFLQPEVFSKSYWDYMTTYFTLGGFSGHEFTGFNADKIGDFVSKLYSLAYRITKSTIEDMPEKSFEVVRLTMKGEQEKLYRQIESNLYASRTREDGSQESLSIASTLAMVTRLQQISAGLFPANNESGEKAHCTPIESVKTCWLQEYCKEQIATSDIQIVVWCRFTAEIDAICRALEEIHLRRGYQYEVIDGRAKMIHRRSVQVLFNDREHPLRILIVQVQAAAFGLDLPGCDEMIYHTNSFSHLERAQSVERGHRMGRTRPYVIRDLVCKNSVDVTVLDALKKKQNLSDMLLIEGFGTV